MGRNVIKFNQLNFFKGINSTYNKIPIKMGLKMEVDAGQLKLALAIGIDKLYNVTNITKFLTAIDKNIDIYFGKKFIFQPQKMYFLNLDRKIIEFLLGLDSDEQFFEWVNLNDFLPEKFLDLIWNEVARINFINDLGKNNSIIFKQDSKIEIGIIRNCDNYEITFDYSQSGDFLPLAKDFKYIYLTEKRTIARILLKEREIYQNIFAYKNDEQRVTCLLNEREIGQFNTDFYQNYSVDGKIAIAEDIIDDFKSLKLLARLFFDTALNGIALKVEFNYGDKIINPCEDDLKDRSTRETEKEEKILNEVERFGFNERAKLYFLDDSEKIMDFLTDNLNKLKKLAEIYYSEDFKKMHVINFDNINSSIERSPEESLLHMNINIENIDEEELKGLVNSLKLRKRYYRLKNGSIIKLDNVEAEKFADFLDGLGVDSSNVKDNKIEIPLNRSLFIENYIKAKGLANVELDESLTKLVQDFKEYDQEELEIDQDLEKVLRPYQIIGVKWLKNLARCSFGGILADDMGLGKTLQILAFLSSDRERKQPAIVIAPTSVIYNWREEAKKFVPQLKVMVIAGSKNERAKMIMNYLNWDLIITSYGMLKNDLVNYQDKEFSYVFIDEAQNIKNPKTINSNSVKSLKSKCSFALTGTPIENGLTELWSIFDFILPGYLDDANGFKKNFHDPIIFAKNQKKKNELTELIKPFILRRLKKEVLIELPDKIETNLITEMTFEQKKLYVAYYNEIKNDITDKIDNDEFKSNQIEVLSLLTRLRQICAHPATFLENYLGGSGKLDSALEIISESIASGHSVILFSQFTKMLNIIKDELAKANINHYYLDGKVKAAERLNMIDDFNADREAVFLISLKAGGTGLNLTKADVVIHFDPWWNPAVEDQASDRAYRMGQRNVVNVYKLVTEGTIEEKIINLQDSKKDLIASVIKPGENFIGKLSEIEIRNLFNIN